jgi:hypothetical protein
MLPQEPGEGILYFTPSLPPIVDAPQEAADTALVAVFPN